jgi:proteic killer suppression protein
MIISFGHKGLRELYEDGKTARLPQERIRKIKDLLQILDSARTLEEVNQRGFRLHHLRRPPLIGYYSIDVSGNYRIVFRFTPEQVSDVDFLDTR